MAKKITRVTGNESAAQQITFTPTAEAKGKALKLRLFAVLAWLLAIGAEAGAIIVLLRSVQPITTSTWIWMIAFMAIDLALVITGSALWKKSNRLDPASRQQKFRFFLQNQLGIIISIIAFLPLIILIFTNKNLSRKQKGILGGIAVVIMLIAGLASADFNPPSVEEYTEQTQQIEDLTGRNHVYWTKSGTRYHIYSDCQHINGERTEEIFEGTVATARELKNITELCKTCESRAAKAKSLIDGAAAPQQ